MHPERAADASNLYEHVNEVGLRTEKLTELIANDEQAREWVQGCPCRAYAFVVALRVEASSTSQQFLAPDDLARYRVTHAVDQRDLVSQICYHRTCVRQMIQPDEGRAALVVNQDEV